MSMRLWRENLRQRHQSSPHRHGIAIKCSEVQTFLVVNVAHHFLATTERAYRSTAADRLGKTDQVRLHRIDLGYTTGSNRYTRFDFVKNQQHAVFACDVTYVLKIPFLR